MTRVTDPRPALGLTSYVFPIPRAGSAPNLRHWRQKDSTEGLRLPSYSRSAIREGKSVSFAGWRRALAGRTAGVEDDLPTAVRLAFPDGVEQARLRHDRAVRRDLL